MKDIQNFEELSHEFLYWKKMVNKVNRYFNHSQLLDLLYRSSELYGYKILKGSRFFRGRIFDIEEIVSTNKQYEEWRYDALTDFQGYPKNVSGAPPAKYAVESRLNGKGISYLYTCKDIDTVIYELRPTINEKISIAEFVTKRNLLFADLTTIKVNQMERNRESRLLCDLLRMIADEFSIPHNLGHNYYFTQYLAGHFDNMGFNGIIFKSSLNPNGENYVFFNPKYCEAIRSDLFIVNNIYINHKQITRQDIKYYD